MYVCICNALTDRRLNEVIAQHGTQSPADAYAACGCRAKCGKCVTAIAALLRQRDLTREAELQGAD